MPIPDSSSAPVSIHVVVDQHGEVQAYCSGTNSYREAVERAQALLTQRTPRGMTGEGDIFTTSDREPDGRLKTNPAGAPTAAKLLYYRVVELREIRKPPTS